VRARKDLLAEHPRALVLSEFFGNDMITWAKAQPDQPLSRHYPEDVAAEQSGLI